MEYIEEAKLLALTYAPKVLGAILTLIIGFWLAAFLANKVRKTMEAKDTDPTLIPFITTTVGIGIKVLVLFSAASMFGLEVTSFIAIFSALAFAIGLALQGNLSHMASGIMILFLKPFKVGDFIVTQGYSGTVKEIQIFRTIMTTLDNRVIIIPNGAIMSDPIENLTANDMRKIPMTFGIGYDDDIDHAYAVIRRVVESCKEIDHSQAVDIKIVELADSSVNIAVRPWCKKEDYWTIHAYMHEHIKKEFDKEGIGIPYPQMDVHVNNVTKD